MRLTFRLRDDSLSVDLMRQEWAQRQYYTEAAVNHGLDHLPIFEDVEDLLLHLSFFIAGDSCGLIHGPWRNHLQTKIRNGNEKQRGGLNP